MSDPKFRPGEVVRVSDRGHYRYGLAGRVLSSWPVGGGGPDPWMYNVEPDNEPRFRAGESQLEAAEPPNP